MPTLVTCPCGHSWSLTAPASNGAKRPLTCPACGDVIRPGDAAGGCPPSETETIAPPAPVDADAVTIAPSPQPPDTAVGTAWRCRATRSWASWAAAAWASSTRPGSVQAQPPGGAEDDPGRRPRRGGGPGALPTEAEAIARLQHPNIVQVHEVGEHEGKPFFSLEFCAGGSLDRKLDGTPLPPREAAALVETLARAMQAAHEQRVIHRDLKPANVLLTEDGTPKITDFGLAKKLDEAGQTAVGRRSWARPSYMAPEQAGGKSERHRPGVRRVRPGGDPVRVPDGPAAVQGGDAAGHPPAGADRTSRCRRRSCSRRRRATWRRSA